MTTNKDYKDWDQTALYLSSADTPEEFRKVALENGCRIHSEYAFDAVSDGSRCVNFVLDDNEGMRSHWADAGRAATNRGRAKFGSMDRFAITHRYCPQ